MLPRSNENPATTRNKETEDTALMKASYTWLISAVMACVGVAIGLVGADIITAQPARRSIDALQAEIAALRAKVAAKEEDAAYASAKAATIEEELNVRIKDMAEMETKIVELEQGMEQRVAEEVAMQTERVKDLEAELEEVKALMGLHQEINRNRAD